MKHMAIRPSTKKALVMNEITKLDVVVEEALAPDGEALEIVELLVEFREGRVPRRAKLYRTLIDNQHVDFQRDEVPERQMLERVNKNPAEGWVLYELVHGHEVRLDSGMLVHLRRHGLERFVTRQVLVTITVNNVEKRVRPGDWGVALLKAAVGVPPEKVLALIKPDGTFDNLDDAAHIHIKGGEAFISHARRGGSA
jgi:hypothetical protein